MEAALAGTRAGGYSDVPPQLPWSALVRAAHREYHERMRKRGPNEGSDGEPMVETLHNAGMTSEMAYTAAFVSIGLSVVSWWTSKNTESAGIDRADRWGIFVGQWAPTFFGLGNALKTYEK